MCANLVYKYSEFLDVFKICKQILSLDTDIIRTKKYLREIQTRFSYLFDFSLLFNLFFVKQIHNCIIFALLSFIIEYGHFHINFNYSFIRFS
jgi:hypothetical protein